MTLLYGEVTICCLAAGIEILLGLVLLMLSDNFIGQLNS